MRRSRGMPRWSNRSVLRSRSRRTGFLLTTTAALLFLVTGQGVLADDEPAARAVLPPPLQSVPAEDRQISEPPIGKDQSGTHPSASKPDGSNTTSSQKKRQLHSAPSRAVGQAIGRKGPTRGASHLAGTSAHRQDHPSVSSERRQSPLPRIGQLSPPSGFAPRAAACCRSSNTRNPPIDPRAIPPPWVARSHTPVGSSRQSALPIALRRTTSRWRRGC